MKRAIIPETYEQWRQCIIVDCNLELTAEFIEQRLTALKDNSQHYTQEFVRQYGQEHLEHVLRWFQQARDSL